MMPYSLTFDHRAINGFGAERFLADAIGPIKEQCPGIIINATTGGSGRRCDGDFLFKENPKESVKGRVSVIDIYSEAQKDWLLKFVMVHTLPDMAYIAQVMKECNLKPEFECYDVGMINNALTLKNLGYLDDDPLYFQCVMGVMGCIPATPESLLRMVHQIPKEYPWSVCAVGLSTPFRNFYVISTEGRYPVYCYRSSRFLASLEMTIRHLICEIRN
jgi:uncharacterized protein (DUF849 family)